MRSLKILLLVSSLALVHPLTACGGDDSSDSADDQIAVDAPAGIDGTPTADSPTSTIMAVTCPATPDATVTTEGFAFSPMAVTISAGQIVKFTPAAAHDVVPDAPTTDPGLSVGFGEVKCLQFAAVGTYHFKCAPHNFKGTITVN